MDATSSPWTYLPVGSHARTSARQEHGQALKELAAAFGLSSPELLGSFDQDTCSLRTSQACLFTTGYEELSESFPDSGMWGSGEVYELQSSAPVTSESGSSLWRTPNATDAIRLWATPHTNCTTGAGTQGRDGGENLQTQIEHWQTPGTDSSRSRGGDSKDEMGLDQEARHWMTPTARDWKAETGMDPQKYKFRLSQQVYLNSLPAPQTPDGPISSGSGQTSRRLSPRFVEWLMGFPVTWTELCPTEPNASDD
jgi:hypothetical protein